MRCFCMRFVFVFAVSLHFHWGCKAFVLCRSTDLENCLEAFLGDFTCSSPCCSFLYYFSQCSFNILQGWIHKSRPKGDCFTGGFFVPCQSHCSQLPPKAHRFDQQAHERPECLWLSRRNPLHWSPEITILLHWRKPRSKRLFP